MSQTQLDPTQSTGPASEAMVAGTAPETVTFPLAMAQEGLWFAEQMVPGTAAYNMPEAWRLQGQLDVDALQQSLDEIVRRHETLRTRFSVIQGKPSQTILPAQRFALEVIDLREKPDREIEAQRQLAEDARGPFDLQTGPLVRIKLYRLADDEHLLMFNMHHIISDAWSVGVFFRELAELYGAKRDRRTANLPELPVQYADFAMWQRESLDGAALDEQLEYWKQRLVGPLPSLALPLDHARPAAQSTRGTAQFAVWPPALSERLKELSRREGATLFMTLLAAFKTLLHRYTGQDDIVVGSPLAGRERPEIEGLIGFFVNTVALRTDLSGNPAFPELLRRVREAALGAHAHQDIPAEKLAAMVQPRRELDRHPLFSVVFGVQSAFTENWTLPGISATRIDLESGTAKFDLTLLVTDSAQGLQTRIEYRTELFEAATITKLTQRFERLLQDIVAKPNQRLSEFTVVSPEEERQEVIDRNQTATAYERELCVHEVFEAQARKTPEATALIFQDQQLSYGELDRRATKVARRLVRAGVGPEVPVGLSMDRSLEMIIGMLAILKAGGTYVPLDRSYPKERIAYMIEDAKVQLLLTSRVASERLPKTGATVLCVEDLEGGVEAQDEAPSAVASPRPDSLAYVIYTSGSTGQPKGTAVPHQGIVRLVRNTNYVTISPTDVFLQLASISFDASTFEIWGALLNGAKLVLFPPHLPSFEELGRVIQRAEITILWLTAGLFHQMVEHQLENLRGVRQLLAGGEALSVTHVLRALKGLRNTQVINGYGPTENTTFTCCYRIPHDWPGGPSVPIGPPISNTQVYILDRERKCAPAGIPGELYIGGDGLARGYLNRPELTAEKFVANPFSTKADGEVLYRTGDLVRRLADGNIEFLGRMDEQLKIRGFRVEPKEIENVLSRHPSVREALIVPRGDGSGTQQLVAYVVPKPQLEIKSAELRDLLVAKLPAYMVPSHFVVLSEFPLTVNGKVDRQALPVPEAEENGPAEANALPTTPTEAKLVEIWAAVLGRKAVGIHESFFDLGGHSLLATQVISRIANDFQVELPVRVIFEAPTIAGLAKAMETMSREESGRSTPIPANSQRARAEGLLARLEELTEAELDELLRDPELNHVLL